MARHVKRLYGIRHGQGWHNLLFHALGPSAYEYRDPALTEKGARQAAAVSPPRVDLVLVSPLTRALQTAQIMFPRTPQVALECLKEYPQHTQLCNRRSDVAVLRHLFPKVDFGDLRGNQWPEACFSMPKNVHAVHDLVASSGAPRVAIVAHSTWLKYWMTGRVEERPELLHCKPYMLQRTPR
jgi:broad specificity phosphatase PhoE